jgi:hypothetical protein
VIEADITFLMERDDPQWLGDYTGIYWAGNKLYTSYVVNSTGLSHIAFAKLNAP